MPYSYNDLANGFRWKRGEILNAALHSKNGSSVQGASSLFCNALFCILEHEFRVSPNKKKAILLWEMFLDSNYIKTCPKHDKVFVPDKAIWASALEMNVEADGGVPQPDFENIQNGMASVLGVWDNGQSLSSKNRRKTSHTRKFKAIGGQAVSTMFVPVVKAIKRTIPMIGSLGTESLITGIIAKSVYRHRDAIKNTIERAGFNTAGTGLKKLTA